MLILFRFPLKPYYAHSPSRRVFFLSSRCPPAVRPCHFTRPTPADTLPSIFLRTLSHLPELIHHVSILKYPHNVVVVLAICISEKRSQTGPITFFGLFCLETQLRQPILSFYDDICIARHQSSVSSLALSLSLYLIVTILFQSFRNEVGTSHSFPSTATSTSSLYHPIDTNCFWMEEGVDEKCCPFPAGE